MPPSWSGRQAGRRPGRRGRGAAFLERAALLTGDPARRADGRWPPPRPRCRPGAGAAQGLLALAEAGPLSDLEQARLELVRARLASCAIDNLWKGTSSQAVQNLNVMFSQPETAGLA